MKEKTTERIDIEKLLEDGKIIQIKPQGYSMYPLLLPGRDEVQIEKTDITKAKRGDVLLYRRQEGILVLHRVYRRTKDGLYMVGDNQLKSRGQEAVDSKFPNGLPHSTLVTDRKQTYFKMNVKDHQVCLAHLLRNAEYLNELDAKQDWSRRFIHLLAHAIDLRRNNTITQRKIKVLKTKMKNLLGESLSHLDDEEIDFAAMVPMQVYNSIGNEAECRQGCQLSFGMEPSP